jgi:alkylhydroperoxidase family enzyme
MTVNHLAMNEANVERLREYFDDDQIVEIACVVGLFNYMNRFAETLGLWPTRPGEGGPDDPG